MYDTSNESTASKLSDNNIILTIFFTFPVVNPIRFNITKMTCFYYFLNSTFAIIALMEEYFYYVFSILSIRSVTFVVYH